MINDQSGAGRDARRPAPAGGGRMAICSTGEDDGDETNRRGLRQVLALAAAAAIALLAVACSGGGSPTATGSANFAKALTYARCMRSHGAPNYPDPNNKGQFIQTPASSAAFSAPPSANRACQHLLPNGGQLTGAQQQRVTSLGLNFSVCMRSHGITNFPDPSGRGFTFAVPPGWNPNSPQVQTAMQACRKYQTAAGKFIQP